jgi:hypothetical protein
VRSSITGLRAWSWSPDVAPKHSDPAEHERILGDIGRLLRIAAEEPALEDEDLVAMLIRAGVDRRRAWRLTIFVPIAFGRAAIAPLKIEAQTSYIARLAPDYTDVVRELRDEPEYRAAADHLDDFAAYPGFASVTKRGPEIRAVSAALDAGKDPSGASLERVVATWDDR